MSVPLTKTFESTTPPSAAEILWGQPTTRLSVERSSTAARMGDCDQEIKEFASAVAMFLQERSVMTAKGIRLCDDS